ncbi:glucosaminidase domain-containing protein [Paenibacillus sp. RC67]|uniref:glycoside hydrolase family 73 protein n=1 Tax=Paenibacillus sp. RC67 TaxID=3039392 RepID=UPI0024ADDE96|nr:glucosaminidase domain-containing protein [Paenibacillus sp. RC67]
MMRAEFIAAIAPVAVKLRREGSPLYSSVRIAQAILETGCMLHDWNNLVGFKVGSGEPNAYWHGRSVSTTTWEVYDGIKVDGVQANWRAYDCIEDCFKDQDLLFNWSRYDRVRAATSPQVQTNALYLCGYATDPIYAEKLNSLILTHELERYDKEAKEPMLDADVANTIINTWMGPDWQDCMDKKCAAASMGDEDALVQLQEQADYIHWLANQLRKASGQMEQ